MTVPLELQNKPKEINIFDVNGEKIFTIIPRDRLNVTWDGKDMKGNTVSTGIYYYQLIVGGSIHKNGKMILLK